MTAIELQQKIAPLLPRGKTQMKHFVKNALLLQLQDVNRKIAVFEAKYNQSFAEFERAWKKKGAAARFIYEQESDYLDWQALETYKRDLMQSSHSL